MAEGKTEGRNAPKTVAEAWEAAPEVDEQRVESVIDAWKTTVDVQMHFNDICMKIRSLAVTVLVGAIGFAGYSMKEALELDVRAYSVPVGTVVALAGLFGWIAFYGMDRHWYHVFLRAAGLHAASIEKRWQAKLPELLLSSRIGEDSKRTICGINFDSTNRLRWFYALGAVILIATAILVYNVHPRVTPKTAATSTESAPAPPPESKASARSPASKAPPSPPVVGGDAGSPKK